VKNSGEKALSAIKPLMDLPHTAQHIPLLSGLIQR